ncbi:uncharacterized protein LOC112501123 [Cynara cardunculus var. scolymus]|uniref:DUF7887 domain-containing protein n=1 Tax=Cynara cardunculus var. scolymus TaxID=59895 RepID=A0A124SEW1_CYNCS|nr:uncharacterized protein LOC112501123 [Cynara cardunculus var. scolymus]KVI01366.1 hypothetical protein Ccrd_020351 [Cynara cardunculus var. scolymus]
MVTTQKCVVGISLSTTLFSSISMVNNNMNEGGRRRRRRRSKTSCISMAKKDDKYPLKIVSQAAVVVLGLGFIDAGYSGDWSRIGVISKENEDLLKAAAFIVVPLCIFLIFSISKPNHDDSS